MSTMDTIERSRYELHCGLLDRDHQVLLDIIDRFEHALMRGEVDGMVRGLMLEVSAYFESHFENEEELMAATAFPGAAAHIAEHDRMRVQQHTFNDAARSGDRTNALTAVHTLKTWLNEHIAGMDRILSEHLLRSGQC